MHHAEMRDNTPDVTMTALRVVWDDPAYRYCYHADVLGMGRIRLTLRRQLRGLNKEAADWYRHWKVRGDVITLLDDVYLVAVSHAHALPIVGQTFIG